MTGSRRPTAIVGDVTTVLADRLLTMVSPQDAPVVARHVDQERGGLVITGGTALGELTRLRQAYPLLPILWEPAAPSTYTATADRPFDLRDGGFLPDTLQGFLDGQRDAGATLAVTPTGFIPPGDAEPMKAALEAVNRLDQDDVILYLPCGWKWVTEPWVNQLAAVAKRSRHPVAIALADPQNPLDHAGVPAGLRRLAVEVPRLIMWRTDLAGMDTLCHGGLAAAVGLLPSTRHITEPGRNGFSSKPGEKTPHVFLRELLRFVRSRRIQDDWYASAPAPACGCTICAGQALDRFTGSTQDRQQAHLHNVVELAALRRSMPAGPRRGTWWQDQVDEAIAAHERLAGQLSVKIPVPRCSRRGPRSDPGTVRKPTRRTPTMPPCTGQE